MLIEGETAASPAELEQAVERRVAERTWGRIHRLNVRVTADRLHVQGVTSSYYCKQLAIQAVMEALGDDTVLLPVLEIDVSPAPPRARALPPAG